MISCISISKSKLSFLHSYLSNDYLVQTDKLTHKQLETNGRVQYTVHTVATDMLAIKSQTIDIGSYH